MIVMVLSSIVCLLLVNCNAQPEQVQQIENVQRTEEKVQRAEDMRKMEKVKKMEKDIPEQVVQLKSAYAGRIVTGNTGAEYLQYFQEMERLLEEFDPVGHRVQDIVFLLGPPTERREDRLVYLFDGGFSGAYWAFSCRDGLITSVERGSSN